MYKPSQLLSLIRTILLFAVFAGCANSSQKRLADVLKETETLAIFSVPGDCRPQFAPSNKFSWDGFWEGVSQGGYKAHANIQNDLQHLPVTGRDPISGMIVWGVIVGNIAGNLPTNGVSNACRASPLMRNRFRYTLRTAFEGRDPSDQIAHIILSTCKEARPEFNSQEINWDESKCMQYRIASTGEKKAKMKEFYRRLDSSDIPMLLKIDKADYGLAGATRENWASHFYMIVHFELICTNNGRRCYDGNFEYKSGARPLKEWDANGKQNLINEFDTACRHIGNLVSGEFGRVEVASAE